MRKVILFLFFTIFAIGAQPTFLMPEEAFKPSASLNDKMQIEATIDIAKDIYIYSDSVKLSIDKNIDVLLSDIVYPDSKDFHGDSVYLTSPKFIINLKKSSDISGVENIDFILSYQGCSKQGLCYEPETKIYKLDVDKSKLLLADNNKVNSVEVKSVIDNKNELSESDSIADTIKSGNVVITLLTFFGFGLLLSLTPCVFPMIPIISGVIISQGKGLTTRKAFVLSVVYVLAMAVAYTIAGVLAGLFGSNLQVALQTPWVIYSFAGVFVVLALSMFGLFELKVPDFIVSKVSEKSHRSGYIGVAIMGFLSALIVGPCVAAPLAGALVYIGQTGDAILGGSALFFMSVGMGLPLIIVGVSAGKFMPKPGEWMTMVSTIFGVMMLGVAIWMVERIVDQYVIMVLYSILGIGFSIYLGAFEKGTHIFSKIVGIIIFIYSSSLFIGAMGGSTSMTKPLDFLQHASSNKIEKQLSSKLNFKRVESIDELDTVLNANKGKKIILDFTAEWCAVCKELEKVTFSDENVKVKMSQFVLVKADLTENSATQKNLSRKYGVFGPPVIMFIDEESNVMKSKTIVGFIEPDKLLAHLNNI